MLQYTGFTMDVIHCCDLELATLAVDGALQTIAELAASSKLQDALLKTGVMWLVFNVLN
jgi:DnaJ family protein C protein 13